MDSSAQGVPRGDLIGGGVKKRNFKTSDNGASQEGGLEGTLNELGSLCRIPESVVENHKRLSDIGTDRSFSNYPLGWASVGNTPFRFYKTHPFGGGNNDPLIISWPKGIADKGAIRPQFIDVIDITPTILDVVGIRSRSRPRWNVPTPGLRACSWLRVNSAAVTCST